MSMLIDQAMRPIPTSRTMASRLPKVAESTPEIGAVVRWCFLLFIFTIPFEALSLAEDFTISRAAGYLLFASLLTSPKLLFQRPTAATLCFLIYLGFVFVSGALLPREFLRGLVSLLFRLAQLFLFFHIASTLFRDQQLAKKALFVFVLSAALLALGTLLHLPGFGTEMGKHSDPNRASALGYGENLLGFLMALAGIAAIGLCLESGPRRPYHKLFLLGFAALHLLVIVSTASRGAAAAFILGCSFYAIGTKLSRRKIAAIILAFCGVAAIVYLIASRPEIMERWYETYYEGKTAGRTKIWGAAMEMISEKPLLGWQPNRASQEIGWRLGTWGRYDAHNLLFHLLTEVGILGTIPFIIGLFLCWRGSWKARATYLGVLPLAAVTAVFIYNVTHNGVAFKIVWLFLALSGAAGWVADKHRQPATAMLFPRSVTHRPKEK